MKLFAFFTIIAAASAAHLPSRSYLPQTNGGSQGSFQQSQAFHQSQSYHGSQSSNFGGSGGSGDNGNRRPQQEMEKQAAVLKHDQEVNENGNFHYSYETSNGIRAEESGNTAQGGSQGGFSYKGDDGNTYTVTFTAGEGGFQAQGAHLPVPPPTPVEILAALEQNAKDEANGIFDDGKYHPDANGGAAKGSGSSSSSSGSFSSSSGSFGSSSSSTSQFGSTNHQGSFNSNSGYTY